MMNAETMLDVICDPVATEYPSIAIVAAHPDDETISAAIALSRWTKSSNAKRQSPIYIIHVTDGAPRELSDATRAGYRTRIAYAAARRTELVSAMSLIDLDANRLVRLDHVDLEVSFDMAPFARELAGVLGRIAPQVVVTHPYEGGHPDHDAAAFAVSLACRRLWKASAPPPVVIEMTSYHNRSGGIETFTFLPKPGCRERAINLSGRERKLKSRMLGCFPTQRPVLEQFPIEVEKFRTAPEYDFSAPPHEGRLYYELLNWEMTGARWRELARAALDELGVEARH